MYMLSDAGPAGGGREGRQAAGGEGARCKNIIKLYNIIN